MSISNLYKPGGLAWRPDANSINAPEGTLLRADNMVPDEDGALSVRRGTRVLYTFPAGTEDVASLYTYEASDGYTYRMMQADSQVYKNPGPGNHTAIWERQFGLDGEKLTNGDFVANTVGWTAGTGWAWETGGRVRHTAGNTAALSQSVYVVAGRVYNVEVVFYGTTAGTVAVTLGTDSASGITGATGTQTAAVTASASGFVTFAVTPVSAFTGAVASASVITDEDDAVDFEFLTQMNYTGGSWEKAYASTGDVGPVPWTTTWEGPTGNDYVAGLVTTLEPVNFNVTFDGTGDIAFGEDHQQCFMARGTTKKKFDGKSFMNWGIAKPSSAPTLSAIVPASTSVCPYNTADSPGYTTDVGSIAHVVGSDGVAGAALQITPANTGGMTHGRAWRFFTANQDFSGGDDDVFDIAIKFADPARVKGMAIRFDMYSTWPGGTWDGDGFVYNFSPKNGVTTRTTDKKVEADTAYEASVEASLLPVDPKDKPRETTPAQVQAIIAATGGGTDEIGGTSTAVPSVDEWVHVSWTRKQMSRVGSDTALGWSGIGSVAVYFQKDDGQLGTVTVDNLIIYAAGEGTLTGKYTVVTRWVRETERYYELSPPSAESSSIDLYANQLRVTLSGTVQNAADDQVTHCWVYIFGGFLDTYYRCEIAVADPQLSTSLVIDVETNEISILTENEKLEPYTDEPRDNIISIAGPWNGRLFTLTEEGFVYPSLQNTPNLFNTYQVVDLSNQGDPLWMVKTSSGVHVGCERDVIFLAGSGDEDADRVVIDLYPHPLNIGTPPFDRSVFVDGNSILYRSTDGLIMLASQGLTHVPDDGIRLLWRGQDRHGVSALNVANGRFRMTVDGKIMYVLVPEGTTTEGSTVVYRLDLGKGQWSRLIYPRSLLSILTEPDGTLTAGSNDGRLLELEYSTGDSGSGAAVTILAPFSDGGNPLVRKDPFDLQFHTDTNANTATVNVYKDGNTASAATYTFSTSQPQAYRIQAEDVGTFIRAQLKITGTFDEFQLSSLDFTYRLRPQHMTYLDTGYLVADDPGDLVWLQEVEIDANSPSNLQALVYLDDRLWTTETVTVSANVRTVYRVPLPRGCKSRRPRIVVKTTANDGAGEIGFDPYFVRVKTRNSGNQAGAKYRTVWPAGQAP